MFYDLNVNLKNSLNRLDEIFIQLKIFGYRGVALTTEIDDSVYVTETPRSKKRIKREENDHVPPPFDTTMLKEKYPEIEIYTRINVILASTENIRKVLQSKYIKQYNILSVQPLTQNVLKAAATTPEIDLISYNPESKCQLSFNRKIYNQFVNQNVFFELVYAPAIASQSSRKNLISMSHIYYAAGRSRNMIVSSGTISPIHIRGPYDVMNFNLLFGLCEDQAKKAISNNCEKLLIRAKKQKLGKAMFEVKFLSSNGKAEENARIEEEPVEE